MIATSFPTLLVSSHPTPFDSRSARTMSTVGLALAAWCFTAPMALAQSTAADADLYQVSALANPRTASGEGWDGDGSAPDVQLTVVTPGGSRAYGRCDNSLSCTWPDVYIPRGATLRVYDVDVMVSDLMGAGPCDGVSSRRETTCQLGAIRLTVTPNARVRAGQIQQAVAAARPRRIRPTEIRGLLVGRTVRTTTGGGWIFVETEPFQARVVSQRVSDGATTLVVRVQTNDASGRQPTSGDLQIVVRWVDGTPAVESVEPITFAPRAR